MRITIITQNEPFFLSENISYLLDNLPKEFQVISCVLTKASPFGKKKGFISKVIESCKVFGFSFLYIIHLNSHIQKYLFHR